MKKIEAIHLLFIAKFVLSDMGMPQEAYEAEQAEIRLRGYFTAQNAREYANYILPNGYKGHVILVLNRPEVARAIAFIAAILRSIED